MFTVARNKTLLDYDSNVRIVTSTVTHDVSYS
jgi:hypothetical protein